MMGAGSLRGLAIQRIPVIYNTISAKACMPKVAGGQAEMIASPGGTGNLERYLEFQICLASFPPLPMSHNPILIKGARQNNLKGFDLQLR